MIGLETRMLLRHYLAQGLPKAAIARRLSISDRTIRRWIKSGELDRDLGEPPRYKPRPPRPTKLDPYKGLIRTRLEAYPELSAVGLFEEIQASHYEGSYSQVRDFVRQVRPRPRQAPAVRFETPPGHQGQVDFAEFDFPFGKRYALLGVLGYSRLLWMAFFKRQDRPTLFVGLEQAFHYFGGVPRELLFDQPSSRRTCAQLMDPSAADNSLSMRSSCALPPTGASARVPAVPTGCRRRARSSVPSATCARTSSRAETSSRMPSWPRSVCAG